MARNPAGAFPAPAGPLYTAGELKRMNATARSGGAVGRLPVVPALVAGLRLPPGRRRVLDYGAGPKARQARWLRKRHRGWDVTAWDIGANFDPAVHDRRALQRKYDVVMASNVLNVQPNVWTLAATLNQLRRLVRRGGVLVANYPTGPRRLPGITLGGMWSLLMLRFEFKVERLAKGILVARR